MFHTVLQFFADQVNDFFNIRFELKEETVVISNLMNLDGKPGVDEKNKIVLSLLNIEEERVNRTAKVYKRSESSGFSKMNPPLRINLYLVFSAYFEGQNYMEGIKFIQAVVAYFQSHMVFPGSQYPQLEGITKITTEYISYDPESLSRIWNMMGDRYLPSVIYRVRTLVIQEEVVNAEIGEVGEIE